MVLLNGAWEPKGYIGPRVEIRGRKLVRLWRGSPVLETGFTTREEDGKLLLLLRDTELRYAGAGSPYASVKACWYADGALTFVDDFPITGESTDVLFPTDNSRYGNVTVVDREMLPLLRGKWAARDWGFVLRFRGRVMEYGFGDELSEREEIIALRSNGDGEVSIRPRDPGKDGFRSFAPLRWQGGVLVTYIPVMDAPAQNLVFEKNE